MQYFAVSPKPTFFGTEVGTQINQKQAVNQNCHLRYINILGSNMPKVVTPLSNNQCKHAKAKNKEFTLSHGEGMGLRVMPNGKKEWILTGHKLVMLLA